MSDLATLPQISIPPELLTDQSLLVVLLLMAIPAVWAVVIELVDKQLDKRAARREAEAKALKEATAAAVEQRILNERSAARIDLLIYQRDEAIKNADKREKERDRCEEVLARLRYPPPETRP